MVTSYNNYYNNYNKTIYTEKYTCTYVIIQNYNYYTCSYNSYSIVAIATYSMQTITQGQDGKGIHSKWQSLELYY